MKTGSIFMGSMALIALSILFAGCSTYQTPQDGSAIGTSEKLQVETQEITYTENARGFLAKPTEQGNYPGVVMIHEWWGLNDNIKEMARELASEGYIVLAVDLFDGNVAKTPEEARALVGGLKQDEATRKMREAANYLRDAEKTTKVGSLGWCFGGGQSLQLALNDGLDATVIYYGNLVTEKEKLLNINWPVLRIFGREDQSIPLEKVNEFEKALDDLGIKNEVHIYDGVGHAFANPTGPNYESEKTKDAWGKTLNFLNTNLKE